MRRQPAGFGAAAALALWLGGALQAAEPCRRSDGTLARYLLCLDVQARRPESAHAGYYRDLAELEAGILRQLPSNPAAKPLRALLPRLHHAAAPSTRYEVALTLVDALDARRRDPQSVLPADCDLFSFLNLGVGERFYRETSVDRRVGTVRVRYDHVVTAAVEDGAITGLLDTADGSIRDVRGAGTLRPMSESEVVALYLANLGLALQIEGRTSAAIEHFDRALELNPGEFVAHLGRGVALLGSVAPGAVDSERCTTEAGGALSEAEQAALAALEIAPEADSPYALLGRIKLRGCAPSSAERYLEQALARRADPVHAYYLTLALEEQRKFEQAIAAARRGKRLIADAGPSRYAELGLELDYLLAVAHTSRADSLGSERELVKAMQHLSSIRGLRRVDDAELRLEAWIDRVDRRIGPVRREIGIPHSVPRTVDASLSE